MKENERRRERVIAVLFVCWQMLRMKQVYIFWYWIVLQTRVWLCACVCSTRGYVYTWMCVRACVDGLLSANNDLANQGNVHLYMTNFRCGNECVGIKKKMELYEHTVLFFHHHFFFSVLPSFPSIICFFFSSLASVKCMAIHCWNE